MSEWWKNERYKDFKWCRLHHSKVNEFCRFCGKINVAIGCFSGLRTRHPDKHNNLYVVGCVNCGSTTLPSLMETPEKACEEWNTDNDIRKCLPLPEEEDFWDLLMAMKTPRDEAIRRSIEQFPRLRRIHIRMPKSEPAIEAPPTMKQRISNKVKKTLKKLVAWVEREEISDQDLL